MSMEYTVKGKIHFGTITGSENARLLIRPDGMKHTPPVTTHHEHCDSARQRLVILVLNFLDVQICVLSHPFFVVRDVFALFQMANLRNCITHFKALSAP